MSSPRSATLYAGNAPAIGVETTVYTSAAGRTTLVKFLTVFQNTGAAQVQFVTHRSSASSQLAVAEIELAHPATAALRYPLGLVLEEGEEIAVFAGGGAAAQWKFGIYGSILTN